MKIAIIGAGLSGLSCALELKKNGVIPDIFEKRPSVGHILEETITTFNIFSMPMSDPLIRLRSKFSLNVSPIYTLKEATVKSPSRTKTVRGKLGYVFKRGVEDYSVENQLARALDLPIIYNTIVDIHKIKNQYDFIVAATGDGYLADIFDLWHNTFNVYIRCATVLGNFDTGKMYIWINKSFTRNCYSYLLPTTHKDAVLVFSISDAGRDDFEYYWKEFLYSREISYKIIETRDWNVNLGYSDSLIYDNIYFTGNAAGLSDDFLGLGLLSAMESGVYAARSIIRNENYIEKTKHLVKLARQINEYRLAFNNFENEDIDKLLTSIRAPVLKQSIYKNPLFAAKTFSIFPKLHGSLIKK